MLLPITSIRPNSYTMSKLQRKLCYDKCVTFKDCTWYDYNIDTQHEWCDGYFSSLILLLLVLLGFRISWLTHCIVGRSNFERTPCALEVQGILQLWKTLPFLRGTPRQSPLANGIMYCTRYCLRTAVRAAANIQRYVKTACRALVSPR